MTFKNLKFLIIPIILLLVGLSLSACSITTTSSGVNTGVDSSVFVSVDSGDNWKPMVSVPTTSGRPGTIADLNVNVMSLDPQDSRAVYLASFERGLYYTYKVTEGWSQATGLPVGTVGDVRVDPKNKCVIYAALANRLYRSNDCSRTWTQVYFDSNTEVTITTIAIDHYNPRNIYIGTSRGEIIKTIDSGAAWRTIQRLNEGVARLIVSPQDSRLVFVASSKNKIYSFISNTNTNAAASEDLEQNFLVDSWTDLNLVLDDFNLGNNFRDIVINPSDGVVYLATDKVILRSPDNGVTWENIKLLQPEKDTVINAFAVNPRNPADLYYVTNTTFFRSTDSGATWTTKKLPTARAGRSLLIDFNEPNIIYLGTIKLK
ncbi:MAG: hypothetical protein WC456_02050 [Patescibacteria group bacterium]